MRLWVDTDFGFDDLWALLLLVRSGIRIDGVSLVAGNAPLPRVIANARGACAAYGLDLPLHSGAARPLRRAPETAGRILGPRGMQSRGRHLPETAAPAPPADAVPALAAWLREGPEPRGLLALGPLSNIAQLVTDHPDAAARIARLVWMGGSAGPGNHSPEAEFNALADPEAAAIVAGAGIPMDVIDLMVCRTATFTPDDMPPCDPLTADLLGGYLDIGLSRGRSGMAIYDPLAALAVLRPGAFRFEPRAMTVCTTPGDRYGATGFVADAAATTRLATGTTENVARLCLAALEKDTPA